MPQPALLPLAFALVTREAEHLVAIWEPFPDKPQVERVTADLLPTEQFLTVSAAVTIHVVDGQPVSGPTAGAGSPVMLKHTRTHSSPVLAPLFLPFRLRLPLARALIEPFPVGLPPEAIAL
jgi:hypothetical protein